MRLLHPLPISSSSSGHVLQPTIGGANPSNSHFSGQTFSSIVGGVTGCGGAGGSAAALAGNPGYNIAMRGGNVRRGGSRRRSSSKRSSKRCKCRSKHCKCRFSRRSKRMRGGNPAPFNGGANLPYQQYMGGQPNSPVFSVGSKAPLLNSGMANPPPISVHNRCGK
jgi:hypothetical protein